MGIIKDIIGAITDSPEHRGKQGEKQVDKKLNPLIFGKREHKQINNLMLEDDFGKTRQIDHVEIRKNGIFVIETKNYSGIIKGRENDENWTQVLYTTQNQMRNPIKQNKSHCNHIYQILNRKYRVYSVIVFTQDNAPTGIEGVVNLSDLRKYLDKFNKGDNYSSMEIEHIYEYLVSQRSKVSQRKHIKNIEKTQKDIQKNICPRCGGKLVKINGKNGTFTGCKNYPNCRFTLK